MNDVLYLKGNFNQRANNVVPNGPSLPKNTIVKTKDLKELLHELKGLYEYWEKETVIKEALVSVFYKEVVAKSNRISGFLSKGKKKANNSIVGARFTVGSKKKHIITHYVEKDLINESINRLKATLKILEDHNIYSIDDNSLKELCNIIDFKKYGIAKTNFKAIIVNSYYVERFGIHTNKDKLKNDSIVTLYKTDEDVRDILKRIGIDIYPNRIIDDTTILLMPDLIERIQKEAPYLIAMATYDISKLSFNTDYKKTESTYSIPSPKNEPTIGVIDTLFQNDVYFSEWVEFKNMLSPDMPTTPKDYYHGTAVTSLIVDGPTLNPDLDDGCGRFKVRHFGVASNSTFSSFTILKNIEEIIQSNRDIKVWNLSLGSKDEINDNFISIEGAFLDEIQHKYDVIFIIAGTNKKLSENKKKIGAPADSINSLIVNSVCSNKNPAPYSREGIVLSFFNKPDVCYYGGTSEKPMNVYYSSNSAEACGTSYAAPWIARKMCYLIDILGLSREVAKALLIDSANEWGKNFTIEESALLGHGIVPIRIENIVKSSDSEIKFILTGVSEKFDTYNYNIPLPINSSNLYPYVIKATLCYFPKCDRAQGVDYTNTELDIQFGRINNKDKIQTFNKNKQFSGEIEYLKEDKVRREFRKWDNSKHIQEKIAKSPKGKKVYDDRVWGITLKTKERLEEKSGKGLKFGVVITLKEIEGINRIDDFIQKCSLRGWLVNRLDIENQIDIYNKASEEIRFE